MPAEQRAEIQFLATHVLEEFSGQGWEARHRDRCGVVSVQSNCTLLTVNPNFGPSGAGLLLKYVASLPPEVALATLAYVKALEDEVERLVSTTVAQQVYEATTDRYISQIEGLRADLAAATARATKAESRAAEQGKQLFKALSVLAGMWNQYCPPPTKQCPYPGHMFMSAGEDCEELLEEWGLLRKDETAIDCDFANEFQEAPAKVKELISPCPAPLPSSPAAAPVAELLFERGQEGGGNV